MCRVAARPSPLLALAAAARGRGAAAATAGECTRHVTCANATPEIARMIASCGSRTAGGWLPDVAAGATVRWGDGPLWPQHAAHHIMVGNSAGWMLYDGVRPQAWWAAALRCGGAAPPAPPQRRREL
eukprot:gene23171-60316_t